MKTKIMIAVMAAFIGLSPAAKAEDLIKESDLGGKFSANVALVNEYFFRGITQSGKGNPAIQGGFDFAHNSGVYVGTWASSINFGGNIETDFYAGWSGEVGGDAKLGLDVGLLYYHYPSSRDSADLDFIEAYLGLSKDFGFASLSGKISVSPDYTGGTGEAVYVDLGASIPAGKYFTVDLHVGRQWIEKNTVANLNDYTDYSIGVGFGLAGFAMTVAWIDNDLPQAQSADMGRFMLMASRSF